MYEIQFISIPVSVFASISHSLSSRKVRLVQALPEPPSVSTPRNDASQRNYSLNDSTNWEKIPIVLTHIVDRRDSSKIKERLQEIRRISSNKCVLVLFELQPTGNLDHRNLVALNSYNICFIPFYLKEPWQTNVTIQQIIDIVKQASKRNRSQGKQMKLPHTSNLYKFEREIHLTRAKPGVIFKELHDTIIQTLLRAHASKRPWNRRKSILLKRTIRTPRKDVVSVIGLTGFIGSGKSHLAFQIIKNVTIQNFFQNKIFWINAGKKGKTELQELVSNTLKKDSCNQQRRQRNGDTTKRKEKYLLILNDIDSFNILKDMVDFLSDNDIHHESKNERKKLPSKFQTGSRSYYILYTTGNIDLHIASKTEHYNLYLVPAQENEALLKLTYNNLKPYTNPEKHHGLASENRRKAIKELSYLYDHNPLVVLRVLGKIAIEEYKGDWNMALSTLKKNPSKLFQTRSGYECHKRLIDFFSATSSQTYIKFLFNLAVFQPGSSFTGRDLYLISKSDHVLAKVKVMVDTFCKFGIMIANESTTGYSAEAEHGEEASNIRFLDRPYRLNAIFGYFITNRDTRSLFKQPGVDKLHECLSTAALNHLPESFSSEYLQENLTHHLLTSNRGEKLVTHVLLNYDWIREKMQNANMSSLNSLILDYKLALSQGYAKEYLKLMIKSIQQAKSILLNNPSCCAEQILYHIRLNEGPEDNSVFENQNEDNIKVAFYDLICRLENERLKLPGLHYKTTISVHRKGDLRYIYNIKKDDYFEVGYEVRDIKVIDISHLSQEHPLKQKRTSSLPSKVLLVLSKGRIGSAISWFTVDEAELFQRVVLDSAHTGNFDFLEYSCPLNDNKTSRIIAVGSNSQVSLVCFDTASQLRTLEDPRYNGECTSPDDLIKVTTFKLQDGNGAVLGYSLKNTFIVWDIFTGTVLKYFGEPALAAAISTLDSGSRTYVVSVQATRCKNIKVWDFETNAREDTLLGHPQMIISVDTVFNIQKYSGKYNSKDEGLVVSGSTDGTIILWDLKNKNMVRQVIKGFVNGGIKFQPVLPGELMVSATTGDRGFWLWDIRAEKVVSHRFKNKIKSGILVNGTVGVKDYREGEYCLESDALITVFENDIINSWNADIILKADDPKKEDEEKNAHYYYTRRVNTIETFDSALGQRIMATASTDGSIKLRDCKSGKFLSKLSGHVDAVTTMCSGRLNTGLTILISGSDDMVIGVWDVTDSGNCIRTINTESGICCVDFTVSRRQLSIVVAAQTSGKIQCYDIDAGSLVGEYVGHTSMAYSAKYVSLDENTKLVSAGHDQTIRFWNTDTFQQTTSLKTPSRRVFGINLTKKQDTAVVGYEGCLAILDTVNECITGLIEMQMADYIRAMTVLSTESENLAVVGMDDGIIKVWDLNTKEVLTSTASTLGLPEKAERICISSMISTEVNNEHLVLVGYIDGTALSLRYA